LFAAFPAAQRSEAGGPILVSMLQVAAMRDEIDSWPTRIRHCQGAGVLHASAFLRRAA
jgi:hypothetical protein